MGTSSAGAAVSYLNLAQTPPTLASQNIAPNLVFLLDDSGSMQFEYIGSTGNFSNNYSDYGYPVYGYPLGNSEPFGSGGTYVSSFSPSTDIATFSVSDTDDAQFRSAGINPIYYNPSTTYIPWACAGPYPESSTGTGYTVPLTSNPAGITCVWNTTANLWVMSNANPNKVYLNPALQSAGYRSVNVWNDDSDNTNGTTANNGYVAGMKTSFNGTNANGFWPAMYANFLGTTGTSDQTNISKYQFVQICPPSSSPTTNSSSVKSNSTVNSITRCTPPPTLPGSPVPKMTYLDSSGNYVHITGSGLQIVRSYAAEMQNFANWYQYSRSHNFMALAGTSQAFMNLPTTFRVDFATINTITNNGNNSTGTPLFSTTSLFDTSGTNQRSSFLKTLFQQPVPTQGTPSRLALQAVGNWLSEAPTTSAPWGMTSAEAAVAANAGLTYLSCRQNYTVFVTDGAWNASGPTLANASLDITNGPTITGPNSQSYTYTAGAPYNNYNNTSLAQYSLANVAMEFWKNDIQPSSGMVNNVPTNSQDPAFWQHMDTFAVGLGVNGDLAFPGSLAGLDAGTTLWPTNSCWSGSNCSGDEPEQVDDLWHTGIDGHGGYLSASSPTAFARALGSTLVSIVNATQASSAVSLNTQQGGEVKSSTQAYLASYHPSNWWGELVADPLVVQSGVLAVGTTANWDASCVLTGGQCPAMGTNSHGTANFSVTVEAPASRTILTWNGTQGIPFELANLTASQLTSLNGSDGYSSQRVDFLRGGRTNEQSNGGALRNRTSVLGDIVNSSPIWVGPPSTPFPNSWSDQLYPTATVPENATGATTYGAFQTSAGTRTNVVYVGSNDGLLHGFRAGAYDSNGNYLTANNDGHEVLAYLPNTALLQINTYTNANYSHQYYVDATPAAGDLFYGNQWHTWLTGGLAGGGQALYTLDVTQPNNFAETNASSLVVNELTNSSLSCSNVANCNNDLGNVYGTPIIRRMHNGDWAVIWGNGFNSLNGTAAIFIADVNHTTGSWTVYELNTGYGAGNDPTGESRPDGIAYVSSADLDGDHVVDYLYAGDLFGNVWRFDVTGNTPASWFVSKFGNSAAHPLFTAVNASGTPQAITTSLQVASIPKTTGAPLILLEFGTGEMLQPGDQTPNPATQTLYGVWDWDMTNWNSLSGTQYASLTAPQTISRATMLQQTVTGAFDSSGNAYAGTGTGYRTVSSAAVCWKGTTICPAPAVDNMYGWYLDLPSTGEEVIYNPLFALGTFMVNTFIPSSVSDLTCSTQTSSGFTMALNPANGGALANSFFANAQGNFVTIQGQVVAGLAQNAVGTPSVVTYGTSNAPYMINQTGGGVGEVAPINPQAGGFGGRATWVQLR